MSLWSLTLVSIFVQHSMKKKLVLKQSKGMLYGMSLGSPLSVIITVGVHLPIHSGQLYLVVCVLVEADGF